MSHDSPVDLALQGGGSHSAFTCGVPDRLPEDDSLPIAAISGTSAGALNAAVLATGHARGGRRGARKASSAFWRDIARASAVFSPFQRAASANPVRFYEIRSADLLRVRINPLRREGTPTTCIEIKDRMSEINVSAGLIGEVRTIHFVSRRLREQRLDAERDKGLRLRERRRPLAIPSHPPATPFHHPPGDRHHGHHP